MSKSTKSALVTQKPNSVKMARIGMKYSKMERKNKMGATGALLQITGAIIFFTGLFSIIR